MVEAPAEPTLKDNSKVPHILSRTMGKSLGKFPQTTLDPVAYIWAEDIQKEVEEGSLRWEDICLGEFDRDLSIKIANAFHKAHNVTGRSVRILYFWVRRFHQSFNKIIESSIDGVNNDIRKGFCHAFLQYCEQHHQLDLEDLHDREDQMSESAYFQCISTIIDDVYFKEMLPQFVAHFEDNIERYKAMGRETRKNIKRNHGIVECPLKTMGIRFPQWMVDLRKRIKKISK